jgi:predicted helicase
MRGDFSAFIPVATDSTKKTRIVAQEQAIFKLFSLGISTNRDEWLYDFNSESLENKMSFFVSNYADTKADTEEFDTVIKWSRNLKRRFKRGVREQFDRARIVEASYRPYVKKLLYQSSLYIDESGASEAMFPLTATNTSICFSDVGSRTDYCVLAIDGLADLHFGAAVDAYQQVPRYRFVDGHRLDNITDWALDQFGSHYDPVSRRLRRSITKGAIFYYVYGVLHDPIYREKYALNLKREFPRIPSHPDFRQWADWGARLMDLHIGYETVAPWPLTRTDVPDPRVQAAGLAPRAILKADRGAGIITLDSETQLSGVPTQAWDYRLGNRSVLDWVLDQHKEKTPKDPTIRARFSTYRFADHKERVADLLARVTRVSVETMEVVAAMRVARR